MSYQGEGSTYYELVRGTDTMFWAHQYATIWKMGKSKWELRIPRLWTHDELTVDVSMHKTLSAAKAVGIVLARFNMATN